jgi:tetratricopeptide (TPR) repeat protein
MPRGRWLPLLLLAAGFTAYSNSLTGPFIFDDFESIVHNPHLRQLWPIWDALRAPAQLNWRPVVSLSLALNFWLGGLHVVGYHLFNLTVHLLVSLLLFAIVWRTLCGLRNTPWTPPSARWAAAAIALIWMVHPLHTESVNYVTQRSELLMAFFLLLTVYCTMRGAAVSRRHPWYRLAVVCCALGMASKEVMVVAPLLVLLYDRVFLSGSFRQALTHRRALYLGLAGTWLVLAGFVIHPGALGRAVRFDLSSLTPWDYAKTQAGVILHYLRLALWPHPLILDYYDWPVPRRMSEWAPQAALVFGLLGATVWSLRRRPAIGFLGAWCFLILAPSSSLLPIATEIAAERRMYLPLCALVTLLVMASWTLLRRAVPSGRVRVSLALAAVMLTAGLLGWGTIRRNEVYRREVAIWQDAVAKRPQNPRAYYNLGLALGREGRHEEALQALRQTLALQATYVGAENSVGIALAELGRLREAEAHFRRAIQHDPAPAQAHSNLGAVLAQQQQFDEAEHHLRLAIQLDPDLVDARNNLAALVAQRALRQPRGGRALDQ